MDMETGDIFNLALPNQKSYDNNTTMDLSLSDLKLFESLDLDGVGSKDRAAAAAAAGSGGGCGDGISNNGGDVGSSAGTSAIVANGNCSNGGSGKLLLQQLAGIGTKEVMNGGAASGGNENDEHRGGNSRASSCGLNGGSGEDHDLMDGALEDDGRSLSDDPDQDCKICK